MKRITIIALVLTLVSLSGCDSDYSERAYNEGYQDGYSEAKHDIYDTAYEDGYQMGYDDAEYEFYDSRFVEGYWKGHEDGSAGKECIAAPRGDDCVWISLVVSGNVYHKYTLPLPECATVQTADGFTTSIENLDEEDTPCPICFP